MFQQLLEKIALGLEGRSIPYMVIGGQAVLLHGEPRLTKDIDLTLHKIIAGRPRDLEDARIVLAKQKEVDLEYVRHWLKPFEESLGEPFLQSLEEIWRAR